MFRLIFQIISRECNDSRSSMWLQLLAVCLPQQQHDVQAHVLNFEMVSHHLDVLYELA